MFIVLLIEYCKLKLCVINIKKFKNNIILYENNI